MSLIINALLIIIIRFDAAFSLLFILKIKKKRTAMNMDDARRAPFSSA